MKNSVDDFAAFAAFWDSIPIVHPPPTREGRVLVRFVAYGTIAHLLPCPQHRSNRRLWGHLPRDCGKGCIPVVRRTWTRPELRSYVPLAAMRELRGPR